jgi:hypothetical protein
MMSFVATLHLLAILTMYIKCSFYSHYIQQHLNLGKTSKTPHPTVVLLLFFSIPNETFTEFTED